MASLVIQYAGAFVVAFRARRLLRRLAVGMATGEQVSGDGPAPSWRRHDVALVLVVVGLALMAVTGVQLLTTLYQLDVGDYSGRFVEGTLGTVGWVVFRAGATSGS